METAALAGNADSAEAGLRQLLARGDALADTVAPVLRHLLESEDTALFSDEIVARIRGMLCDLARQLLGDAVLADDDGQAASVSTLATALSANAELLTHLHATALEWQLAERLQANQIVDPVLSPLLQALVSSKEGETGSLAMKLLASQARFCQMQRRMQLSLLELPADLLHSVLTGVRTVSGLDRETRDHMAAAENALRAAYDEGNGRLGLLARLLTGMGMGALAALSVRHAGAAIFLAALSRFFGQNREMAVLSTTETQLLRLALALRAGGLTPERVQEELYVLNPDIVLPEDFGWIGPDSAAAMLAEHRHSEHRQPGDRA